MIKRWTWYSLQGLVLTKIISIHYNYISIRYNYQYSLQLLVFATSISIHYKGRFTQGCIFGVQGHKKMVCMSKGWIGHHVGYLHCYDASVAVVHQQWELCSETDWLKQNGRHALAKLLQSPGKQVLDFSVLLSFLWLASSLIFLLSTSKLNRASMIFLGKQK